MDDADGWVSPWADDSTKTATTDDTKKHDGAAKSGDLWADGFGETSAWAAATTAEVLPDWAVADAGDDKHGPGPWARTGTGLKGLSPGLGYEQWGAGSEWASFTHEEEVATPRDVEVVPAENSKLGLEVEKPPLVIAEAWGAASDVQEVVVVVRPDSPKFGPGLEMLPQPVLETVEVGGPSHDQPQEVGVDLKMEKDTDGGAGKVEGGEAVEVKEAEVKGIEGKEGEMEMAEAAGLAGLAGEVGEIEGSAIALPEASLRRQDEGSEQEEEDRDSLHSEPSAATATTTHTDVNGPVTLPGEVEVPPIKPPAEAQVHNEKSSHAEDDDDFGDFAEEAEFDDFVGTEPEVKAPSPPPPPPPSEGVPAFEIDTSFVRKLYPIPTSSPDPPPVEGEVIHTTGARKAWYRLTQDGTLRKKNAADDDDYVRVTWLGSNVQGEVHKIVAKWLTETRSTGRHGRKSAQNLGSMFGWGTGSSTPATPSEANKRLSLGTPKIAPDLHTHSRYTSESGLRTPPLPLNTSAMPSSLQRPSIPSPRTPHFGWASSSAQPSPLAKPSFSGHNSPVEKTSFDAPALNAANSIPASPRVSLSLGRNSMQSSPTAASFASSAKSGGSSTPRTALNDVAPEPPSKDEAPPTQPASSSMDDWGSFGSSNEPPTPTPMANIVPQPTALPSGDWSAFEMLVSSAPSTASTPLPQNADDGWAVFESIKPTSPPALPSGPASPMSSRNSTIDSRPGSVISTKKPAEMPKPLAPAPETTNKPLPPQPSALSILTDNDHNAVDEGDEWGDMQSPTKSLDATSRIPMPVPVSLPIHPTKPSMSSGTGADLFAGLDGFAVNTLTTTPSIERSAATAPDGCLFEGLDAFSANTQTEAANPASGTAFGFGSSTTTSSTTAAPSSDSWDLSFFDKLNQPTLPPPVQNDLWDAPAPPTKGRKETEEGKIIKKLIDGLPDLSYML